MSVNGRRVPTPPEADNIKRQRVNGPEKHGLLPPIDRAVRFQDDDGSFPPQGALTQGMTRSQVQKSQGLFDFNLQELYEFDIPHKKISSNALTNITPKIGTHYHNAHINVAGKVRKPKHLRHRTVVDPAKKTDSPHQLGEGEASEENADPMMQEEGSGDVKPEGTEGEDAASVTSSEINLADLDEDQLILMQLKTGQDAINYFAQHGKYGQIKLVHLNRAKTKITEFRPYDLVVVSRYEVEPEHFTMSASGVVHIQPKEPSEFVSLGEWIRQASNFNILRTIKTFKYYLVNKMFRTWHAGVRYKLYCRQRDKVVRRLFLAKTTFCDTLLDLNRLCYEMRSIRMMQVSSKHMYVLDEFADLQASTRSQAAKHFETIVDKMQNLLEKVCEDVTKRSQLSNDTDAPAAVDVSNAGDNKSGSRSRPGAERSKSMFEIKRMQEERMRAIRQAAAEARQLGDFIRLADYMVVENLLMLTVSTQGDFLNTLQQPRKQGLFSTTLGFDATTITFSPNEEDLHVMMSTLTEGMIAAVNGVPRLLYPFKMYFGGKVSGPHVGNMIRQHKQFIEQQNDIVQVISHDFAEAREYSTEFEKYRIIYDYGNSFDFEAFTAEEHTVPDFVQEMTKLQKWFSDIDKHMKLSQQEGILQVDSKKLKAKLLPITVDSLEQLKSHLTTVARDNTTQCLNTYQARMKALQDRPRGLKDFAEYVAFTNQVKEEAATLFQQSAAVDTMYDLLRDYGVKVPTTDEVKKEDLHQARQDFAEEQDKSNEFLESKKFSMRQTLEKNISALNDEVLNIMASLHSGVYVDPNANTGIVLEMMDQVKETLEGIEERSKTYTEYQTLFQMTEYEYSNLKDTIAQYDDKRNLWETLVHWQEDYDKWMTSQFTDLDVEEIDKEVQNYIKNAYRMEKKFRGDAVANKLKGMVDEFKVMMPTIKDLGNPNMKHRHWDLIFKKLESTYIPGQVFHLHLLSLLKVFNHKAYVSEVSGNASGEAALEQMLEKVKNNWQNTEFTLKPYRDQDDVFILGGIDEITVLLEDSQVTLQTMLASRYVMGIRDSVEVWEKKLAVLAECMDEWVTCQRSWMYLETIFGADDIKKQLPVEAAKFDKVDMNWKKHMRNTNENPNVVQATTAPGVLEMFTEANVMLEQIQKSLEDYLETKRGAFPRFYFLSNDELLEILSQTREPRAVQPHLRKCFDAMAELEFYETEEGGLEMQAMISSEKEKVEFSTGVMAEGNVEGWLTEVEKMMRTSLYDRTKSALDHYPDMERSEWFFAYPQQGILTVEQILWTVDVEKALRAIMDSSNPNALQEFSDQWQKVLDGMVELVRGELSFLERSTMGALIVIDVHARDVVYKMIERQVSSVYEFEWTRQLRYYWETDVNDCVVRQTNTYFLYAWEYLGNCPRLVITPLTDKCYMTLTGALHLMLGGAPAGPAGTGKTETTKDLAKALARQCVVFNCSDGLDYKMMGRFFSGLSQAGAWACFDEFNRIDIEVLSVIAQQLMQILGALKGNKERFMFEGKEIPLNRNYGSFITMNPGYAGRTELPDNLKALYRPVAMMVPDYALIAEIMLFSEGFLNGKALGQKMVQLFKLSSEQLSKQDHYDFGMRAVKSVLVMAGGLKRSNPDLDEDVVLIRAMRDANVPKFLADDVPLFMAIIQDLFPGMALPVTDYGKLLESIHEKLRDNHLQVVDAYVEKITQLYETMIIRHGVMLVGLTATGKTTVSDTLGAALTQMHKDEVDPKNNMFVPVHQYRLNPKSIRMGELYGEFNEVSHEWTDGLIAALVRQCVSDTTSDRKWVVFDGPVDALWIENMNTVLDDNKTLCLANGERIKLPSVLTMLFEVADLAVASPATVSRCGMVYLEPVHLGWRCIPQTWMERRDEALKGQAARCCEKLMAITDSALEFIRGECREPISSMDSTILTSCLNNIDALLVPERGFSVEASNADKITDLMFIFAFVWSFGGNLDDGSREKFDGWVRQSVIPSMCPDFPKEGLVFDFYVNTEKETFEHWNEIVPEFNYDPKVPFFNILVPTMDTTSYRYVLSALMEASKNVLLMAESGVGKSVIAQQYLSTAGESFATNTAMFSAQTTSQNLQDVFETTLEKKRKNLFGPPAGKRQIFLIDDLNMPKLDTYGSQEPIELLRQTIDNGGFYDRKKLFFKNVKDTQFIGCCAPPGGGRNNVTPRLICKFNMLWMPQQSTTNMTKIFESILAGFLAVTLGDDFQALCSPIVKATVEVYGRIATDLLPTPSKSHYTFNLRDLSKVIQGILQITAGKCPTPDTLSRLWTHETARVFADRLINNEDKAWFSNLVKDMLSEHFNLNWEISDFSECLFGSYMNREENLYEEITDRDKLGELLREYLEEYNVNNPNTQMRLVFFHDAVAHLSRICRIIRSPRGNALLVGVGGSGRQSMCKMAAFVQEYWCFQIEVTKSYGMTEFRDDLKRFLMKAGAENKPTVFLFSDTQIVNEGMLEDINNILNAGDVPNLWANDDYERIVAAVTPLAKAAGKVPTRDIVIGHFIELVRANLHMVICMSPIGDGFRSRCRMFPSLINCCTIDWYTEWPKDALQSVSNLFFKELDLGDDECKKGCCELVVQMHYETSRSVDRFMSELRRQTYVTPTSYLELLNLYISMLGEQRDIVDAKISRLKGGLDKLAETEKMVGTMKVELADMQPELERAAKATAELMVEVARDQKVASEVKERVSVDEEATSKIAAEAEAIRTDAQADLDEAMPAYNSAVASLKSLRKEDITEVKSFAKPPELVQTVMEAVCILKGYKTTWDDAKKLLSQGDFLKQLETYDKDNIPDKVIKQLKKYINNPNFQPDIVAKTSSAAKSLCMWVRAMDTYNRVAKTVEPKKIKLKGAEAQLESATTALRAKQAELKEVEDKVAALEAKYNRTIADKEELETKKQMTTVRLERADKLISGLSSEAGRWSETVTSLNYDRECLIGNVLLACGFIAYSGPFTAPFRRDLSSSWVKTCKDMNIPVDEEFNLVKVLADPAVVREWNIMGLPADQLSTENGLLVTRGRRWGLMIDPQSQANRWIKNLERANGLKVIKLSDNNYIRTLENAIRVGSPVLLENVEETLDPMIDPILQKNVYKSGGRFLIRLGDQEVDYSPEFKFFITTKLANPHYPPEICVKVTIINFTVTPKGLEDQLLADVVRQERPDLEEQKDSLIVQIASDKKQLKEIEDKILHLLATSSGDILDDEVLINTLAQSKTTSNAINERVAEAEETSKKIDVAREGYRVVATRGSILYFVIADFALADPMYQYSLAFFSKLFNMTIEKAPKSNELEKRLHILVTQITETVYINICRGLFEKDKLMFSFVNCIQILRGAGKVADDEWGFFLRGGGVGSEYPANTNSEWLPLTVWKNIVDADSEVAALKYLKADVVSNPGKWKEYFSCPEPQNETLPEPWCNKLSGFNTLLVLRIFRPEKVTFGVRDFVGRELGELFMESPPFDLEGSFNDSTPTTPIIFVLSPGADPANYLIALANQMGMGDRLKMISLGQGQGPVASRLIEEGRTNGEWICLQNCHLAASWMPQLERILEQLETMEIHDSFRLWLTSMPAKHFPASVLQAGIKLTNEPPKGLKANLTRSYLDLNEKDFEDCSKPAEYKKMLFALCFFHAVILERRKFGSLGWNIPYEWMNSDLQASMTQLKMYLEEQDEVPYETLRNIVGNVNYGGRVTDAWDQRCCDNVLNPYFCAEIMDDDYKLSPDGLYYAPPEGDLASYRTYIKGLPLKDPPEVFGLHANADISFQQKETNVMLSTMISMQPRAGGSSGGKSPDDSVLEMAAEFESKMPKVLDRSRAHASTFEGLEEGANSLGLFLGHEMTRFNKLIRVMKSSLQQLQRAVKGFVVMSADLEKMYFSFLYNQVPLKWADVGYPSLKPLGSWFVDFEKRVKFLETWLTKGVPSAFWISGFFFPQGFLTGALQTHARKHKIPIDRLRFNCLVLPKFASDIAEGPNAGVYIYGLFMDGARWDMETGMIQEARPGELMPEIPAIHLDPVDISEPVPQDAYNCPFYKTSTRAGTLSTTGHSTNFVTTLTLKTDKDPGHWIRRGVALISMTSQ